VATRHDERFAYEAVIDPEATPARVLGAAGIGLAWTWGKDAESTGAAADPYWRELKPNPREPIAVADEEEEAHAGRDRAQVQPRVQQDREDGEDRARRSDLRLQGRVVDGQAAAARVADQDDGEALR